MYYEGEGVKSHLHGFGRVVCRGKDPMVEFLDGRRCKVPGKVLRLLPEEDFERELANRAAVDAYTMWRVTGVVGERTPALPMKFNLRAALLRNPRIHPLGNMEQPEKGVLFNDDDLNGSAVSDEGDGLHNDQEPIKCDVSPVEEDPCVLS